MNTIRRSLVSIIRFRSIVFFISFTILQIDTTVNAQTAWSGDLFVFISNVRSAMPGSGSNGFTVPTDGQIDTFRTVVNLVLSGEYPAADSTAHELGYVLYEWTDTGDGDKVRYVLAEEDADRQGRVDLGWGTFIFDPDGSPEAVFEVPHPLHDINTWRVGIEAYRRLDSRFFLMAGTHRYANGTNPRPADVAHNTQNMFHVVHKAVAPSSAHAVQIHGFSRTTYPGYPDVVLSNGTANPSPILDSLATAFELKGYSVGIFDGVNWSRLGATTNTQGQWSNGKGFSFIHMELEYSIRSSGAGRNDVYNVLDETFGLAGQSIGNSVGSVPGLFSLKQNYPNPFNSQTSIEFVTAGTQLVTLEIYSLDGRMCRRLLNGVLQPGLHRVVWDARGETDEQVPSGVYFCRLRTDESGQYRKMVLLK